MLRYRPDIDGLRALAVLPVILFHFNVSGFQGGFVGVDVFFVISGYLITSLIIKSLDDGTFSFRDFYERRARRLLPAAFIVLLVSYFLGWLILMPYDFSSFGKSLVAFSLFSSNFHFMNTAGYFDLPSQVKPLLHTWSLSVEEQYYILFPCILLVLYKFGRKSVPYVLLGICALSLAISVYTVEKYPNFGYYMLPSRAWELMLGSLLAIGIFPRISQPLISNILSGLGLVCIGLAVFLYSKSTPFPGWAAALPCFGTVFVMWSNQNSRNVVGHVLSYKPFVFIGKISYPLYLWHWPLFVFYRYSVDRNLYAHEIVMLIILTFVLSYLTWVIIEQPIRRRKFVRSGSSILISTLVITIAFVSVGRATVLMRGVPWRLDENTRSYAMGALDRDISSRKCHRKSLDDILEGNACTIGIRKASPDFILWGDSHASMLVPAIRKIAKEKKLYGILVTKSDCRPIHIASFNGVQKRCIEFNKTVLGLIKTQNIRNVIISAFWGQEIDRLSGNKQLKSYTSNITTLFSSLEGRKVWVFSGIPTYKISVPSTLAKYTKSGRSFIHLGIPSSKFENRIKKFQELYKHLPARFIDIQAQMCGANKYCSLSSEKKSLYYDNNHLSTHGAHFIGKAFVPVFNDIDSQSRNEKN